MVKRVKAKTARRLRKAGFPGKTKSLTVEEILDQLPYKIKLAIGETWHEFGLTIAKKGGKYLVYYACIGEESDKIGPVKEKEELSEVAVKMWLWLKSKRILNDA